MLKPSLFHRRRSRAPIFFVLAALLLIWQTCLLFFSDKNARQINVLWEPMVTPAMADNLPMPVIHSKPLQDANAVADAKAVASAPLPEIKVGVIDKSNQKNHAPTAFEEHMVAFPNTPSATNTTKSTLPTSIVPTIKTKQNVTQLPPSTLPIMQEANQQILNANPEHYTIQLSSVHQLDNAKVFAKDYGLEDKATYFRTEGDNGDDLFVLIYGDFATAADARAALDKLPEDAKSEGAFIAKMSNIQDLLKD